MRALQRRPRRLVGAIGAVAAAAAALLLVGAGGDAGSGAACGAVAAQRTLAGVDAAVTALIYRNELAGTEVSADLAHVTGARDLARAVASGNAAAARRAVARLVFHPLWHIVRLRALDRRGRVLADVGGPHVVAPVPGVLRWQGRVVGRVLMSVQDDAGLAKLESRFVGAPIGIYVNRRLVAAAGAAVPAAPPSSARLTLAGTGYLARAQTFRAFPGGVLSAVVFAAAPSARIAAESCQAVRALAFGRVAENLARIFARLSAPAAVRYRDLAGTVRIYTGAQVFVRRGGVQLAGTGGAGPPALPDSGTLSFAGSSWLVFSFEPRAGTRVYVLAPPG